MFAKSAFKSPLLLQLQGAFLLFPVPLQPLRVSSICPCPRSEEKKWALFATRKQFLRLWFPEWILDNRALHCTCAHSSAHPPPKAAHSFVDKKDPSRSLNKMYFRRSRCCHRRAEAFVGAICWSQGLWQCLFKNHADNGANLVHLLEDNLGKIFFYYSEDKHVFVYWFLLTFCFVASWLKQLLYSETSNLAFSEYFFFEREILSDF